MSVVKVKQRVSTRYCLQKYFNIVRALCGGKASLPIKANTAIGERHETWKGGLSFRKRRLFFVKMPTFGLSSNSDKVTKFEEKKL